MVGRLANGSSPLRLMCGGLFALGGDVEREVILRCPEACVPTDLPGLVNDEGLSDKPIERCETFVFEVDEGFPALLVSCPMTGI